MSHDCQQAAYTSRAYLVGKLVSHQFAFPLLAVSIRKIDGRIINN